MSRYNYYEFYLENPKPVDIRMIKRMLNNKIACHKHTIEWSMVTPYTMVMRGFIHLKQARTIRQMTDITHVKIMRPVCDIDRAVKLWSPNNVNKGPKKYYKSWTYYWTYGAWQT